MAVALRIRSIVLVAAASGCAYQNPDFGDETSSSSVVSDSAGVSATGQISTTDILTGGESDSASSGGNATIDGLGGSTSGTSDASTTNDSDSSITDAATSNTTGEPAGFDKQTLRNYNPDYCYQYLACTWKGYVAPASQADTECFTPPVPGPVYVSRVGINVLAVKGPAPLTLEFRAYDTVAKTATGAVVHSHPAGPVTSDGFLDISLAQPVMFGEPAFCVTLRSGDESSQVVVRIDDTTPGADHSFFTMDNQDGGCDIPEQPLADLGITGKAHWCVNVDIQPTP